MSIRPVVMRIVVVCSMVAACAAGAASQALAATPHTLFRAPNIRSLIPGGGRIGWIQAPATGGCYTVWVRGDTSGVRRKLTGCRTINVANPRTEMLATGSTRIYWLEQGEGNNETDYAIVAAGRPGTARSVDHFVFGCGANGCGCGNVGNQLGPGALLSGDYLYATSKYDGDPSNCAIGGDMILTGGGVRRATASGHALIGSAPGASLVAAATARFAELPLVPNGPAQPDIQVRNAATGALIRTIATGGVVGRLSMSGAGVVAQVGVNGATTLRLYNPSTGALVHSRYVRSNAKLINASGARALYLVGNDIHIFNLLTGQTHLVYRSPRPLGTLRLDGRLIVWLGSGPAVMGIKLSPIPG